MLIDAHLDLAFNAVAMGGDIRLTLDELRASPFGGAATARRETPTVTLPALREAGVRIVFGTIFVQAPTTMFNLVGPTYRSPEEANAQGWAQLRYYHDLAAQGEIQLIGSREAAERAWSGVGPLGVVPLMEGADPIRDIAELPEWYAAGIRLIGPAWSATRYCGGTGAPGPLTPAGRELMRAMTDIGIGLDLSHMAEESFWEALELFRGPVMASHANCRSFIPTDRHLSDDMIRAIVERDGVIGVVLANPFLVPDLDRHADKSRVTLEAVVRHIDRICEVAGDTRHVGIGSDFDGGFGVEGVPAELDSIMDLPRIGHALLAAGWSDADVAGVLGGNWARWLGNMLP